MCGVHHPSFHSYGIDGRVKEKEKEKKEIGKRNTAAKAIYFIIYYFQHLELIRLDS